MSDNAEKRKYQRVDAHISLKYKMLGDKGDASNSGTVTNNLSEGGVRFRTKDFISRSSRMMMEVDVPLAGKSVQAISKVAWIRKAPNGDDYDIGGQFLEINGNDKKAVAEYIQTLQDFDEKE
ncbi:MAG: PilZ domain-containing protein [Candidatus Tantalella remota]|nr:PilZ domain-containing protein [Candidatus Tantalella remota]